MRRGTEATIDLQAIRQNSALACRLASGSRAIAVIKGNAYGHGTNAVAQSLQDLAPAFAVAIVGDEVVLWDYDLPVNVVAAAAGTIGCELLTRISGRVPRHYCGG